MAFGAAHLRMHAYARHGPIRRGWRMRRVPVNAQKIRYLMVAAQHVHD